MTRNLFVLLLCALLNGACGSASPTTPSPQPAPTPAPTPGPPPAPTVTSVTFSVAKNTLEVGSGVQITAKANYSDETNEDVPMAEVKWSLPSMPIISISPTGWVVALAIGKIKVLGEFKGVQGPVDFTVVSSSTSNTAISGIVYTKTPNVFVLTGATVEVIGSTDPASRTTTDSQGRYRIQVPSGFFTVRYSHSNYQTREVEYSVRSGVETTNQDVLLTTK